MAPEIPPPSWQMLLKFPFCFLNSSLTRCEEIVTFAKTLFILKHPGSLFLCNWISLDRLITTAGGKLTSLTPSGKTQIFLDISRWFQNFQYTCPDFGPKVFCFKYYIDNDKPWEMWGTDYLCKILTFSKISLTFQNFVGKRRSVDPKTRPNMVWKILILQSYQRFSQ